MFIDKHNKRINPAAAITYDGVTYNGNILQFPDVVDALGIREIAEPEAPAEYMENPGLYYRTEQDDAPYVVYTRKSDEQIGEQVTKQIVDSVQAHLDDWARERNYDGILSLCTYATSAVPNFAAEGQRGVDNRDATWDKLYEMLAEVQAGTRPMPLKYEEIEPELPVLAWP